MAHTEQSLSKLSKNDLARVVLNYQGKFDLMLMLTFVSRKLNLLHYSQSSMYHCPALLKFARECYSLFFSEMPVNLNQY